MKKLLFITLCVQLHASAAIVYDTLYINRGTLTISFITVETCAFNDSANYKSQNKVVELNTGDTWQLHVINNDLLDHTFTIDGIIETGNFISGGGTADFTINFPGQGAYRFYSDEPYGKLLGGSSIVMVGYENYARYYWNLWEQQDSLAEEIDLGNITSMPNDYWPDLFTVNMKVPPDLNTDTLSYVNENVGDTIIITTLNSGNMDHGLHFHGYHVEILQASKNPQIVGWEKDTYPISMGEVVVVMLIPDKEGLFPVHEHNLINVSTNGVYPGGMLNLLDIQP